MHIEVIVRVNTGQAAAKEYGSPGVMELTVGEAVAPDRKPGFGEEGYGRPQAEHPYDRAEAVLEYLCAAAKVRTRDKLAELREIEAAELVRQQAKWDAEHAEPTSLRAPADVPF